MVIIPETGRDTSQCINAYSLKEGETVSAEATHILDTNTTVDCDGGFELNNPFVQVMGMWFAIPGGGGTRLKASSCPALLSVYRGDSCDSLECAPSTYNDLGCQVEWESANVGEFDYVLVQNIELNSGDGEGFDMPIRVTVDSVVPAVDDTATIVEEGDASTVDSDDTDSSIPPLPAQLDFKDLTECQNATKATIGGSTSGDFVTLSNNIGYCDGPGGAINMDDVGVEVLGSWFTIDGTGATLRADACLNRVTIFSGECDNLTCIELTYDQFGCQMEWKSEVGRTDYILLQNIKYDSDDENAAGSAVLRIQDLDTADSAGPADEDGAATSVPQPEGEADVEDNSYWDVPDPDNDVSDQDDGSQTNQDGDVVMESHLDTCQSAQVVSQGDTVLASASQLSGDALECEGGFNLNGFDIPILGAWFGVAGTGGLLRASACPARITVYSGTCDSLECAEIEPSELGCEVEWASSPEGQLDYILIQTIGFEGEDEGFVLPVSLSIEDPITAKELETTALAPSELTTGTVLINGAELQCTEAIPIDFGESSVVPFRTPFENVLDCVGGLSTSDKPSSSVYGSWFAILGTAKRYRASACPALISVYQGECDTLVCVASTVVSGSGGCDIEWEHSGGRGQPQYILVQSLQPSSSAADDDEQDPVVLSLEEVE